MNLLGSNAAAEPEGFGRLPGRVNYFGGAKALTGIQTYAGVRYRGFYARVDLKYYGNQRELEHDFLVRPGGKSDVIEFELRGGKRPRIDSTGALSVSLSDGGDLRMSRPRAYQEIDGERREVVISFVAKGGRRFGFKTGAYDRARELVIDPVLSYSTYLGGAFDAFVTKLNPAGTAVVFSTHLGGSDYDTALSLAINHARNVYVGGVTASPDFPTTPGAVQSTVAIQSAFVSKLSPQGDSLLYSTTLGGKSGGDGARVAVDAAGDIYLAGTTSSADFLTTPNAFRPAPPAANSGADGPVFPEGFLSKIHPAGGGASDLVYSTYFGGNFVQAEMVKTFISAGEYRQRFGQD